MGRDGSVGAERLLRVLKLAVGCLDQDKGR